MSSSNTKQQAPTGSRGGSYELSHRRREMSLPRGGETKDLPTSRSAPAKNSADDPRTASHRMNDHHIQNSGGDVKKPDSGKDRMYRMPDGRFVKKNRSNQERKNRKANFKKRDEALLEATATLRENPEDKAALAVFNGRKETPYYWNHTSVKGVGAVRLDRHPSGILGFDK